MAGRKSKNEEAVEAMLAAENAPAIIKGSKQAIGFSEPRRADDDDLPLEANVIVEGVRPDPLDEDQVVCLSNEGSFQLIPAGYVYHQGGATTFEEGVTLEFGTSKRTVLTDEEVELLKHAMNGTLKHDRISPQVRAALPKLCREAGLQLIRPGMVGAPMPTWDELDADEVVAIARKAGYLNTPAKCELALRHEKQASKREKNATPGPRKVRKQVVSELEALIASYVARPSDDNAAVTL
jgi:hypothetical protein